uniref:Putative secreted protein n=1 Tax=Anopheles darlingi TaxID=43151 RepID=A0A2M4DNU2_ANODA
MMVMVMMVVMRMAMVCVGGQRGPIHRPTDGRHTTGCPHPMMWTVVGMKRSEATTKVTARQTVVHVVTIAVTGGNR